MVYSVFSPEASQLLWQSGYYKLERLNAEGALSDHLQGANPVPEAKVLFLGLFFSLGGSI